jgi:hypothetical protein
MHFCSQLFYYSFSELSQNSSNSSLHNFDFCIVPTGHDETCFVNKGNDPILQTHNTRESQRDAIFKSHTSISELSSPLQRSHLRRWWTHFEDWFLHNETCSAPVKHTSRLCPNSPSSFLVFSCRSRRADKLEIYAVIKSNMISHIWKWKVQVLLTWNQRVGDHGGELEDRRKRSHG